MVFRKEKEMIWNIIKNFLSEIAKDLLSDEIKHIKKVIRCIGIFVHLPFLFYFTKLKFITLTDRTSCLFEYEF